MFNEIGMLRMNLIEMPMEQNLKLNRDDSLVFSYKRKIFSNFMKVPK